MMTMGKRRTPHTVSNRILFEALYRRHNDGGCECQSCRLARHNILTELARQIKQDECPEKASKWLEANPKKCASEQKTKPGKSEYFIAVDPGQPVSIDHDSRAVWLHDAKEQSTIWMSEAGYMPTLEQVDELQRIYAKLDEEPEQEKSETFDITTQFPKWFE